jgi:hypothetical protein
VFGAHQRFPIARQLAHIDALDALIAEVSVEIARQLQSLAQETEAAPSPAEETVVPPRRSSRS